MNIQKSTSNVLKLYLHEKLALPVRWDKLNYVLEFLPAFKTPQKVSQLYILAQTADLCIIKYGNV